jgi:hypothetical protein
MPTLFRKTIPGVVPAAFTAALGAFTAALGAFPTLLAAADGPVDGAWLTGSFWDDGQAEIAFYEVERTRNQYGRADAQRFLVGTYLVKHDYDPEAEAKASARADRRVPAFKWALFYEIESGSYQYKRSWVLNAAQADLAPLKSSLASFDWCSNLYRELSFHPGGTVASLARSDDYGNRAASFPRPAGAWPVTALPLLVRALDFSSSPSHGFAVLLEDGAAVAARAELAGRETIETPAGPYETEKVTVRYEGAVPSLVGEQADAAEHYWRATGPGRLLVKLEAESGRYKMVLVEELRSAYWREDFYPRLERVGERP